MNVRRDAYLDGKTQKARKWVLETQKTCLFGGQGGLGRDESRLPGVLADSSLLTCVAVTWLFISQSFVKIFIGVECVFCVIFHHFLERLKQPRKRKPEGSQMESCPNQNQGAQREGRGQGSQKSHQWIGLRAPWVLFWGFDLWEGF